MGGDKSGPHLHGDDDGGKKTWGSSDGRPSLEVDWSEELTNYGEPSIDVNLAHSAEVRDETDDPAVDQVSNEVGILSLFDEHLSFSF